MNCKYCDSEASFVCGCSKVYLCEIHLGQHLIVGRNHDVGKLFEKLEPSEQSALNLKLNFRIETLLKLENQIYLQTSQVIKLIQSTSQSIINTIREQTTSYQELLKKSAFKPPEFDIVRTILNSEMVIHQFSLEGLHTKVIEDFSQELFSFLTDPTDVKQIRYKRFLETHNSGFKCLAVSNDGKTLLTGSEDTSVRIWNIDTRSQLACLLKHKSCVSCLAISKDANIAVSGSFDKKVIIWDLKKQCFKQVYSGHDGKVYAVGLSEKSDLVISACSSQEIRVWLTQINQCIKKISTKDKIWSMLISSENLIYFGVGEMLEGLDLTNLSTLFSFKAHKQALKSIAQTKTRNYIITSSDDKSVKIWKESSKDLYATLLHHSGQVCSVAVTEDDKYIISGSCDSSLIIWSIESKSLVHLLTLHDDHIYGVTTVKNFLFSASRDSKVQILNLSSISLNSNNTYLSLTPFTLGSQMLKGDIITYGSANQVKICDINLNKNDFSLQGHEKLVKATCISSRMNILVTSSKDSQNNLIVWDLRQKTMISELTGHDTWVFCVDISNDEMKVISGDGKGKIGLWDLESFSLMKMFRAHNGFVNSVKFTNDGKRACSGGDDKMVFLWDLENCSKIFCLVKNSHIVLNVFITSDDKYVATCDHFNGVRIFCIEECGFEGEEEKEVEKWSFEYKELHFELMEYLN